MIVGIVAEGKSDYLVLRRYIEEWAAGYLPDGSITIIPYQPTLDATSDKWGKGGWTLVKVWCENNPPVSRQNQIFEPLFRHEKACDFLVVQLDGDIVGTLIDATPGVAPPVSLDKAGRAEAVNSVLDRWLWPDDASRTVEHSSERHINLPTIRAIEAWIIAGLDTAIADPEEEDASAVLMGLRPDLTVSVDGGSRLKKKSKSWKKLAEDTAKNLNHIRVKCDQCGVFLRKLES